MPSRGVFSPEEIAIIATAFEDTLRALGLVNRNDPAVTMVAKRNDPTGERRRA